MIWIFSDSITERLNYTLNFIFKERGVEFFVTNDPVLFENQTEVIKFVYADHPFQEEYLTISPADLLFQEHIAQQRLQSSVWNSANCLSFSGKTDPIASVFYVLSRYEEYLPFEADEHGRFQAKNSILNQNNWLNIPICDVWAESIIDWLSYAFNSTIAIDRSNKLLVTFDIDNTYAFKHKSPVQLLGGRLMDVFKGNHNRLAQRSRVLSEDEKDPFDTFESIVEYAQKGVPIRFFWLLGDLMKYDRNVPWNNVYHQRLILNISMRYPVGIHPSYHSNKYPHKVAEERGRLEHIIGKPVYDSRQHFLMLKLPQTYQKLVAIGIKNDYSMGFADAIGFRMGTARSVSFFDLERDQDTSLLLHPFAYMDGTLNQYMGLDIASAKNEVHKLIDQIKCYGGLFCCIWHNETIGEQGIWSGWKEVLDDTIAYYNQ